MSPAKQDWETEGEHFEEGVAKPKRDLRFSGWRWVLLLLMCTLCIGNNFVYVSPAALQTQIQARLHIDTFEYTLLYSVYSFPNIVLPFLGGFFVDYVGVRIGLVVFGTLVCTGQALFALGCSTGLYWLAILGRIVFGMGAESQTVTQLTIVSKWFKDKELALALGATMTVAYLSSMVSEYVEPALYGSTGSIDFPLWFGFIICAFSLSTGILSNFLDKYRDHTLGIKDKLQIDPSERIQISELRHFSLTYWLLTQSCMMFYVAVIAFMGIAGQFYQFRFGFSTMISDTIVSFVFLIAAVFCPVFGTLADRIGCRGRFMIVASGLATVVHLWFVVMPDCNECWYSAIPMILLGIGYAMYTTSLWASIPFIVKQKAVGTAFGVVDAVQNLGLSISPMILGAIKDGTTKDSGYFYVSVFLLISAILCTTVAICLQLQDKRSGSKLNLRQANSPTTNDESAEELPSADGDMNKDLLQDDQTQ